jgi:CRP/FNR family transcriptional regulator, cyclic AMP receptor protein
MDASALRECALFQPLGAEQLRKLAGLARHRDLAAGEVIFRQGDPGDALHVVISGTVRLSREGAAEPLGVLGAGGYFGELALVDDAPRAATATAASACALAVIARDDLEQLLFLDKDLAYDLLWALLRTLAARLRAAPGAV